MRKLPLRNSQEFALIDDDCFELVKDFRWTLSSDGAVVTTVRTNSGASWTTLSLHRIVMGLKVGSRQNVKFIDGNKLNNQRFNLRLLEKQTATESKVVNEVKYYGVAYRSYFGKYLAFFLCPTDGLILLGHHSTAIEAAKAVDDFNLGRHGAYAKNLNFPTQYSQS